jgi:UDP-N-acetylmuramoyl-L-alanyl-D-glutamate--2,6-diaminopimelate ligase
MQLRALLDRLHPSSLEGPLDVDLSAVTRDSRAARLGTAFVAIRGARVDGHDLAPSVDASVVVAERKVDVKPGTALVVVSNTKVALAELAAALNDDPGAAMRMIGVTGTNGKTTTTTLVEDALRHLGWKAGRIGTTGNSVDGVLRPTSFTTPEAPELQALLAEMRDEGVRAVAMEVSSIGLAQHRVDAIPFHTAVFTNLTQDHLDFHGTMAAYAEAKARLFRALLRPVGGLPRAILCGDDPGWRAMDPPSDRWLYGFGVGNDLRIVRSAVSASGTVLGLETPLGPVELQSAQVGRHNALNLTAALGVVLTLGFPLAAAAEAVGRAVGAPGRLQLIPSDRGILVFVDYAHSDDALANVLPVVRELIPGGRLWVVFGAGGDRDRTKRPKMGRVAAELADEVVVTSDNPRHEAPAAIAADILAGITRPVRLELDRERAIRLALSEARPGDAVVLAGKGHETYQQVGDEFRAFDDREVALRALGELERRSDTAGELG